MEFSKSSVFKAGFISLIALASLGLVEPAKAVTIDFTDSSWNNFGDVSSNANGGVSMSTNALFDDDFPNGDSDYNFSGNAAVESPDLENNLGVTPDIAATEGSGTRNTTISFSKEATLTFDWIFRTNENPGGLDSVKPENDYAFISINGVETILADIGGSSFSASGSNYANEVSGNFTTTLAAGNYDIAFGVIDREDFNRSSALIVSNADAEEVPEPLTILGSVVAIAFGVKFKQKHSSKA